MRAPAPGVAGGQPIELGDHLLQRIANAKVTANQIRVVVADGDTVPVEGAAAEQIEEHRAAADERLEVASELWGIKAPQHRQQLPLAADPLEKGAQAPSLHA